MPDPSDLNPVVAAYLAEWIRRRLKLQSARALAAELGITHATVSTVANEKSNAGSKLLMAVARLEKKGPHAIETDAIAWARDNPRPTRRETAVVYDERYPNRRKAIEFVQSSTRPVSKAAVDSVLSMSLQSADDPNTEWWLDELRAEDRRLSKLAGEPVVAPPVPSRPPLAERIAAEKKKRGK